jgi:starch synthase
MADSKFNPAYDNKIPQKYSKKTIENKMANKQALCGETGLPFNKKVPLICVSYPLTDDNKVSMVLDIMNGVLEMPVEIVIAGVGTEKYQRLFTELAEKNPTKVVIVDASEDEKRKIYAAADIVLIPTTSEECVEEAQRCLRYGVVPIMPPMAFAEDYNPNQERGNSFIYLKDSPWSLFAGLVRAVENYRFPYDWKNIASLAMELE